MVPVDIERGDVETVLPSKLEKTKCQKCDECEAALYCPNCAIVPHEEIDLLKCIGCGSCKDICPYDAVSTGKIITMHMREIDIANTEKLSEMEGIEIFATPQEVLDNFEYK
ncbi:MAG: 4Fe-4S binding protein, partial [Methanobrevibacter sp.]|nr:4Fe-4S binding protein [Methanobrevibacter sp.]